MTRQRSFCRRRIMFAIIALSWVANATAAWAQFETRGRGPLPNESLAVTTGDFNNDGKVDVAVVGDYLSILLGNGDGTFQPPINYQGPFYSIAVADFNNDGNADLVVTPSSNNIAVFLGRGDGTFQSPIYSPTTGPLGSLVVGDFNGDHRADVAGAGNSYISILLGKGDGTFESSIDNNSFFAPGHLAVGDFNNDHLLDLAAVGSFGSSATIGVLLGNGDGTLQSSLTYPLSDTPDSVAAADFNGDGKLDVAVGGYLVSEVTVLLGNGDGSFRQGVSYPGGGYEVIVGDFRGTGKLDMVAEPSEPGVAEFLGNGDGTFQQAKIYHSGAGYTAAVGDLNGDHKLDVVLLGSKPLAITSMLNTGVLEFSPCSPLAFGAQRVNTTSKPKIVSLTNTGSKPISFNSMRVTGAFRARDTCGGTIAAGAVCRVDVTFTPSKPGHERGGITIVDSASSKPQYIELSGVGK
jgi:hypothetical protein